MIFMLLSLLTISKVDTINFHLSDIFAKYLSLSDLLLFICIMTPNSFHR